MPFVVLVLKRGRPQGKPVLHRDLQARFVPLRTSLALTSNTSPIGRGPWRGVPPT
jgi:hypothetical protein